MQISPLEAYGSINRATELFQDWRRNPAQKELSVPRINTDNFQLAQHLLERVMRGVQADNKLVLRLADDPVLAPKITNVENDSIHVSERWVKPWTQLQLTDSEVHTFADGSEIYLGTKHVKIAASSIANILATNREALQIMPMDEARGIRAQTVKRY